MKEIKSLISASILGIIFGIIFSKLILLIFPDIFPIYRHILPLPVMFRIFLQNSFLSTLIVFGGIIFSFAELKVYKSSKLYRVLDKILDPLYFFLKLIARKYKKLGPMYRSCYFSLITFPLVCIFLIFFIISFYFSIFIFLSQSVWFLLKLLPHILIELLVFSYSAYLALRIAEKLEIYLFEKRITLFYRNGRKLLVDKKTWRKLFVLYFVLLIGAVIEKIFVELV
jgi:hypothetical protein